ncbi:FAD-binding oxidoreductase [Pseudonocardia kujensis]|uniref:FAD-binding oxidoreductase n=1 Tax=Pseudonocardia kujensis TaxID=1128675 RepID=UPI001E4232C2|nr:FAD-binding oxidoreductase [Pseudonocardia kujensis]MCE0768453.1 FAD-binding oxidoreductase [Pseudonocardia kujensis]
MPTSKKAALASALCSATGLREQLSGTAYVPQDPGYAAARRGAGTTPVGDDRRPAVVVLPESTDDIARTLEFALTSGLEVSVRSGGHDVLGASSPSSGVLLDLSMLSAVRVDPATGIARAGAGARSGALVSAAASSGRAPVLGMNPGVGLGGITLGGGIGWLCGSHGATVDTVLAVDVVTAHGRFVRADAEHEPELFWALRGGGGNFGVVTGFTFALPALDPIVAGMVVYRTEPGPFLRFLDELLADSPDELDVAAAIWASPEPAAFLRMCWSGDAAGADTMVRRIRGFSPPVFDDVRTQTYAEFINQTPNRHFDTMFWRGGELAALGDAVTDTLTDLVDRRMPQDCTIYLLHYMHGALCRVPDGSTPLTRTPGHLLYSAIASWAGPHPVHGATDWVHRAAAAIEPVSNPATYVNYLSRDDDEAVRVAFGPHYDRLRAVKRAYDPDNVFRNNRNIRP